MCNHSFTFGMTSLKAAICACFILSLLSFSNGFSPLLVTSTTTTTTTTSVTRSSSTTTELSMAGFGGGGVKSKNDRNNKKQKDTPIKLKPKLQWDRYSALKNADKAQVGIRLTNDDAGATSSDWLEVGRVKIKDNENIPLAVAIQRAIIAEHGKRLYPLQVSKKMSCEWGYLENDEWKAVDVKAALIDATEGIEKSIGFEGKPDPASGFYCVYDNGKIKLGDESSFVASEYSR